MAKMAGLHADGVTDLTSYALGRKHEFARILAWLESNQVIRQSMLTVLNPDLMVVYTEQGPKDFSLTEMKGQANA